MATETQFTSALTDSQLSNLRHAALRAAEHAYAPYSNFRVGVALLLESPHPGAMVTGCNVENASFRLTTCAEQAAIAYAVTQFGPTVRIRAAYVVNLNGAPCSPCGACRQTLAEFSSPEALVTFPGPEGSPVSCTLADLLTHAFALDRP